MPDGGTALDRLRRGEPLSLDEISAIAPAELPEIRVLALSGSAPVRRAALVTLIGCADPGSDNVYELCLRDEDPDLAYLGVEGLQKRLEAWHQGPLFAAFDLVGDPHVRAAIAMTLGMLDARVDYWELQKRLEAERDEVVRPALLRASARAGNAAARQEVLREFRGSREAAKREYFDRHLPYLKGPWLLKALIPVLDDEDILVDLRNCWHGAAGEEIPEAFTRTERACDRAVTLVAEISGRRFGFNVGSLTNYTPEQRAEVRRFLEALPE